MSTEINIKKKIAILDEGGNVTTDATSIDFVGAGVTTTAVNGDVTVSITATGITTLNSLTGSVQTLGTGSTGTDFAIVSSGTSHTFNLPTASTLNRGALSSTDWSTFNDKQATLISGTNIKTINGSSILGSGNLIANNSYLGNTLSMTYATPDTIGFFSTDVYATASVTQFRVWSGDTSYYNPWLSKIEGNSSYVLQIGSLQGIYGLYLVTAVALDSGNAWYQYSLTLINSNGTFVFGDDYTVSFTKVSLGLTLTTIGTSGAATLIGNTLNVPQYAAGGSIPVAFSPMPVSVCDTAPTAASTQYYYQTISEVTGTISKVKMWGFSGTDLVRFGIYRGVLGGSMTLIGQGSLTCSLGPNEILLTAEIGQTLDLVVGENLVVGYYANGISWRTIYDVGISDAIFGITNTANITTMHATPTGTATGIRFACTLYS